MRNYGGFDNWPEDFQETFDAIPGVGMFRDYEYETAMGLFELGFMHHEGERGYDEGVAHAARAEFFSYTGLPEEFFPWDEWREAMGYSDEF